MKQEARIDFDVEVESDTEEESALEPEVVSGDPGFHLRSQFVTTGDRTEGNRVLAGRSEAVQMIGSLLHTDTPLFSVNRLLTAFAKRPAVVTAHPEHIVCHVLQRVHIYLFIDFSVFLSLTQTSD